MRNRSNAVNQNQQLKLTLLSIFIMFIFFSQLLVLIPTTYRLHSLMNATTFSRLFSLDLHLLLLVFVYNTTLLLLHSTEAMVNTSGITITTAKTMTIITSIITLAQLHHRRRHRLLPVKFGLASYEIEYFMQACEWNLLAKASIFEITQTKTYTRIHIPATHIYLMQSSSIHVNYLHFYSRLLYICFPARNQYTLLLIQLKPLVSIVNTWTDDHWSLRIINSSCARKADLLREAFLIHSYVVTSM